MTMTNVEKAPVTRRSVQPAGRFLTFRILVGGGLLACLVFCAAFAPLLAPFPPTEMDLLNSLSPPIWALGPDAMPGAEMHRLGTDSLGRDVLSNLLYGTRVALYVAFVAGTLTMLTGTVLGLCAGYFGGRFDLIVSRLIDLWMCFPPIVLAMILMVALGAGVNNIILAIVLVDWTRFARVVRAETLVAARRDYVAAARLLGISHWMILSRELLPAIAHIVFTLLTLEMGIAVMVEALLSFAGMGVEPSIPAWGQMIADGRLYLYQNFWPMLSPIVAIFLTVLSFNLLGDGLRKALDPKLKETADGL
jgi:peptide/nickel transport system permease protein